MGHGRDDVRHSSSFRILSFREIRVRSYSFSPTEDSSVIGNPHRYPFDLSNLVSSTTLGLLAALPWVLVPILIIARLADTKTLTEYSADTTPDAPKVSVILPARNEAKHIGECVRSLLASRYPNFEIIVVNDHSTDDTARLARDAAAGDPRLRVIENPDLPDGWFGKQWACHNGALVASGAILLFTDADTRHGAELLPRSVNAMRGRNADLFSVAGGQEMVSFWEKLIQPHIFGFILARYGSTDRISNSTDPYAKIANGQFIMVRRDVYDKAGGHEAVRSHVAEDLRLAQEWTRLGYRVHLITGIDYMSTRMYDGLGDIIRGWGKNVYAAGRDAVPFKSPLAQALLRWSFPLPALWEIVPSMFAVLALTGVFGQTALVWGVTAYIASTLYWTVLYFFWRENVLYALLHPLASIFVFHIFTRAAWKGDRVEWKGRAYVSRS
jgi:chlorobactene glucosyltransferase